MTPDPECPICRKGRPVWVRLDADPDRHTTPGLPIVVCDSCKRGADKLVRGKFVHVPRRDGEGESLADIDVAVERDRQLALTGAAVGGGKVAATHPDTSRAAAATAHTGAQREAAHRALAEAPDGLLAEQVAAVLDVSPNQAATRLQELWEVGAAAVERQRGRCVIGKCRRHDPPDVIHYPQDECRTHGDPIKRRTTKNRSAAVWGAL